MKKLLSLFTILCCVLTFVSFPTLAVEASNEVITFSDNFETETDTVPDNWSIAVTSANTTATVETEADGNKYLRLATTDQCWSSALPSVVTKDNKVSIPLNNKKVLITYRTRMSTDNSSSIHFYMRAGIPGGANATTEITGNNYKFTEIRSGSGRTSLYYYTTNTWPSEYQSIGFSKDVWYDISVLIDPVSKSIKYKVGNKTSGYKILNGAKMEPNSLSSLDVINNLSAMICYANKGAYMDIDDVSVNYVPDANNYYDDFESETDATPDNWEVAQSSENTTVTVQSEDNGNKYLRLQLNDTLSTWNAKIPAAATKTGVVSMPFTDKPVLVKYRARFDAHNGSAPEFHLRVAVPGGAAAPEDTSNKYKLVELRTATANSVKTTTLRYYTTNTYPSASNITFNPGEWYDIYAYADPLTATVKYMVGNKDGEYEVFNGAKLEMLGTASVDLIDNLYLTMLNANKGLYMDLDDVYVGYYEDYAGYLPAALYFEDNFETAAVNSAPVNWVDRAGIADVKVLAEDGNNFVRITKPANTTGVPQVTAKDGFINIPWNGDDGKGIIIEAKMRQQNSDYRSLLMLNAPYLATDAELNANYSTPFYVYTNMDGYFMPGYSRNDAAVATLGEWFHYRAVILPSADNTEIRHYFNDVHVRTTTATASDMPELFNPESLYNIAFTWRHSSANPSAATTEGYMDFDDIKVYELKEPIYEVKVTDAQGAEITDIENGTINVNAKVVNNGTGRTVDVIAALYTKAGDSWKLTEAKKAVNSDGNDWLYAYAWRTGTANLTLNVTDKDNQMIKVFVWNRTQDLDNDPSVFETSLRAIPVFAPIVID